MHPAVVVLQCERILQLAARLRALRAILLTIAWREFRKNQQIQRVLKRAQVLRPPQEDGNLVSANEEASEQQGGSSHSLATKEGHGKGPWLDFGLSAWPIKWLVWPPS